MCLALVPLVAAGCDCGGRAASPDAAPAGHVTEPAGLVPDRVAVALPDSLQASRRCAGSAAQGQVEELVKHIERTQEYAVAQIRLVDVLIGAALDSEEDVVESEAGAFLVEVSEELAAAIAADVADYPALAANPPPAGFVFESPHFCWRRNQPGPLDSALYLDRYGFAAGAGCDDPAPYMTRLEWNADRTLFRITVNRYRDFYPVPHFNYSYDDDNPLPDGAGDILDGHATYTYDATAGREQFRLAVLNSFLEPHDVVDSTYELSGTMAECGPDECLGFQLSVAVIGEVYDRVEIHSGRGDVSGIVFRTLAAQREGEGGTWSGDWQTIADGGGCVEFERSIGPDGYGPWEGEGTGAPTDAPFYDEVIVAGVDYNTAAIDFSGLDGRPDALADPPRLFALVRGGGDPAASDADVLGVGYDHFPYDQVLTRYLYWGSEAEVAAGEAHEVDWDPTSHAPTFTRIPGSLALAP
ncbi:MAG TPA: hypothetical protein VFU21_31220 [Kofleriaceae bacterium]|nr:hypothetical protein [Kofleriaceae bacterium]